MARTSCARAFMFLPPLRTLPDGHGFAEKIGQEY